MSMGKAALMIDILSGTFTLANAHVLRDTNVNAYMLEHELPQACNHVLHTSSTAADRECALQR